MKVKTIPMLQVLIMGSVMLGLKDWLPWLSFGGSWTLFLSLLLMGGGVALVLAGGLSFRKVNTTVTPVHPHKTTQLVTDGVYRLSRNPMYLGFLLVLIAWGLFLGEISSLLMLPVFVWVITRYQIRPEEKVLTEKFAHQYTDYVSRVRRWI